LDVSIATTYIVTLRGADIDDRPHRKLWPIRKILVLFRLAFHSSVEKISTSKKGDRIEKGT
jgi:hypothetical protein